jgi:hypothetical protein
MTRLSVSYDLAGRDIPPSADAARNGNRESFLTGRTTIREDPMNRTPARAGIAHYDLRLAELSTLRASHGCSNRRCSRTR